MSWPNEIHDFVMATFGEASKAYGQIAVQEGTSVFARTVHLHALTEPEPLIAVNSNTKARKWKALERHSIIGGCFWDITTQTQTCFEGKVELVTRYSAPEKIKLIENMWFRMRDQVRLTYLLDEMGLDLQTPSPSIHPDTFSKHHGVILIRPVVWDLFHNNPSEYRFGERFIYKLVDGQWTKKSSNSLHSS